MNQKKLTHLTLFVVVAGTVFLNEFIIRNSSKEQAKEQDREVASFGERFEPGQIKWEQELAKTVSKQGGKTLFAAKPSVNDKFLFEVLQGKYEANVVNGQVLKISLISNQTALELNTDELIKNYSNVFKDAKTFDKSNIDARTESVILKNGDGRSVGTVKISRDDQGRVTALEIQ